MNKSVRLAIICILAVVLAGCAPALVSRQHIETVQGKQYTYVAIQSGSTFIDHTLYMSLYGPDGSHIVSNVISNNGLLETLGGPALQTLVPAYNAFELTK